MKDYVLWIIAELRGIKETLLKASFVASDKLYLLKSRIACPGDVLALEPEIRALSDPDKEMLTDWLFLSDCGRRAPEVSL